VGGWQTAEQGTRLGREPFVIAGAGVFLTMLPPADSTQARIRWQGRQAGNSRLPFRQACHCRTASDQPLWRSTDATPTRPPW